MNSAADLVIFSAPALGTAPDASTLASNVDGVLVVADRAVERTHSLLATEARLEGAAANTLGCVLVGYEAAKGGIPRRRNQRLQANPGTLASPVAPVAPVASAASNIRATSTAAQAGVRSQEERTIHG
jgi:hypothetical protein